MDTNILRKKRSLRDKTAKITGVILYPDKVVAPNRQHKKIIDVKAELKVTGSAEKRKKLQTQLRGRVAQVKHVQDVSKRAGH